MLKWKRVAVTSVALSLTPIAGTAHPVTGATDRLQQTLWIRPIAASCKQVSSCEEAVELWCGGYRRADGDGDGVPCENVCSSVEEVDQIRVKIGC
ncbi:excalibur calcium-binding domain-containing protein [Phyllobacterium sophorae]|uniref:Calcium-binding protein n=1 Tax=Phyllobacterium sophorae TaxID=1520277 RepID=A0A2P7B6W5_9HYPH|nr:excalibur calcium-binding domain-containing protein [Phyllobacterium sophorae]PSH62214.1 calcium-binding protein [Phyllobacterium sophorae]